MNRAFGKQNGLWARYKTSYRPDPSRSILNQMPSGLLHIDMRHNHQVVKVR